MQSKRTRLDRFLSDRLSINRRDVRLLVAQKRIKLDHHYADNIQQLVDQYTRVQFDDKLLQANVPSYIMLHKPAGVVSATKDARHTTVIDLLPGKPPEDLHLAGRPVPCSCDMVPVVVVDVGRRGQGRISLAYAEHEFAADYRCTEVTRYAGCFAVHQASSVVPRAADK